jgi:antibiotic biosynthesis monooxygenase (ABM) superfamily enzyme
MSDSRQDIDLRTATAEELAARERPRADMVTSVIEHEIKAGCEPQYEVWLKRITPIAERFPGHRGLTVLSPAPGSSKYTLLLRFDTLEHAQTWLESDARAELLAEVDGFLQSKERIEVKTGLEFWFKAPHGQASPSAVKQALVTLVVLYPLTLLVPALLAPIFNAMPALGHPLVANLITDAIIIVLLTWVIMPPVTRALSKWLFA